MALPAGSFRGTDIRFRVILDMDAQTMTFTDLIAATYNSNWGETLSNIRGKATLTAPSGTVFYVDITPVITGAGTPVWTITAIDLPLDANGNVETGEYTFKYDVSVNAGSTYPYTFTKYLWMDYVKPVADLNITINSAASVLTSSDATTYGVPHSTDDVTPATIITPTITRVHTIYYPVDPRTSLPVVANVVSSAANNIIGPSIYTGDYRSTLKSTVYYSLENWGTSTGWAIVSDIILANANATAKADTCLCDYYNCINSVNTQLEAAAGVNDAEYQYLKKVQDKLNDYVLRWQLAKSCGEDSTPWCTKIRQLLVDNTPCDCAEDNGIPTLITPVAGTGIVVIDGSLFLMTFSAGSGGFPVAPNAGDVHGFNDSTGGKTKGDIFRYSGSAWIFQGNFAGAAGNDGAAGSAGTNGYNILSNDIGDVATPGSTTETLLKHYDLIANVLSVNGMTLKIVSLFKLAHNDNGKYCRQYFSGDLLIEYYTDELVGDQNDELFLVTVMSRVSATSLLCESYCLRKGGYSDFDITTVTCDLTQADIIEVKGKNEAVAAADVTCKSLRIEAGALLTGSPISATNRQWGVGIPLTAYTPVIITYVTPFLNSNYLLDVTTLDTAGSVQQPTITAKDQYGFTVETIVNTTMQWRAES